MTDSAAAQQAQRHTHQVRILRIHPHISRVVLIAYGNRQLIRHPPKAHQPGAHLFTADTQQVLLDQAVADVGVYLKMPADQRKMRRKYMGQQQVTKIVQQPAQVSHADFGALLPRHGPGQPFNHRRGVDRLLPVRSARLRMVLGQAQGFAQRQAECQVDHQINPQHAHNGVFDRANLALRGVKR